VVKKILSKEIIRYGISGGLIALINIGVYSGLLYLGMRYEIANIIALVLSRFSGFTLNKYFVFRSHENGLFWREFWGFMLARGFSGLVDYFGLILLVEQFQMHEIASKWIVMTLVIILNYILGKFLVFRQRGSVENTSLQSENEQKYQSKNPLRRLLSNRLTDALISHAFSEAWPRSNSDVPDVLDAGCGEGFVTSRLHAAQPEMTIVGLDVSQDALDIARQCNPDVQFMLGSVCALPFENSSIHTVLLSEVLEHLNSPLTALKELERVASHVVIVSVPHEPWFWLGNLFTLRHVARLGNPVGHINHWTHREFQTLIRENMSGTARFYKCFPWSIAIIDQQNKQDS